MYTYTTPALPGAFIWRRLHSLTGLFISLYLIEHLLVNSQAALLFGEDGSGFIRAVNGIHDFPYLPLIEMFLLGVPILLHMIWGVVYLQTAKYNVLPSDGSTCSLPYPRNYAYTWQRITSWILLFGIIAHVIHMRFVQFPDEAQIGAQKYYITRVSADDGLYTLSKRLDFSIYGSQNLKQMREELKMSNGKDTKPTVNASTDTHIQTLLANQEHRQDKNWESAFEKKPLAEGEVWAVANNFGTVTLLMIRDTFKSPLMITLYTIFVLAACFHGFNGLWTFMISWGVTLSERAQRNMRKISTGMMIIVAFWGLISIWGTYWINLKQ
jgi:succinate dehydrogenase / fumarate reductase cytochrome b subunit